MAVTQSHAVRSEEEISVCQEKGKDLNQHEGKTVISRKEIVINRVCFV